MAEKRVVVGMSGGVDSSVAALILKRKGYDVIGVTMQIWQDEDEKQLEVHGGCCGLSAVEDARRVAGHIGIPYYVMNFKDVFKKKVMDYFASEYLKGRTPNPCIACNRFVKWEALLSRSVDIGADYIATGHYARIKKCDNKRLAVAVSATSAKDQTYALYSLTQDQLKHTLMPVGDYSKDEIRNIAREAGLPIADKPDSQEICFIPDNNHAKFIETYTGIISPKGNFVDGHGNIIGRHEGITRYTIGQRKGLGLAFGHPVFVTKLLPDSNEVVIGESDEVFGNQFKVTDLNWMSVCGIKEGEDLFHVICKIRYSHKGDICRIKKISENTVRVIFERPQRAITPGQAAVFYDSEGTVIGGGTISGS